MRCPRRQEAVPGELMPVRDARHTNKTQAGCRILPSEKTLPNEAIAGSGERTLAQAVFLSDP
jgi:hypothetical protein